MGSQERRKISSTKRLRTIPDAGRIPNDASSNGAGRNVDTFDQTARTFSTTTDPLSLALEMDANMHNSEDIRNLRSRDRDAHLITGPATASTAPLSLSPSSMSVHETFFDNDEAASLSDLSSKTRRNQDNGARVSGSRRRGQGGQRNSNLPIPGPTKDRKTPTFLWKGTDQQSHDLVPLYLFIAHDNPQLGNTVNSQIHLNPTDGMKIMLETKDECNLTYFILGNIVFSGDFEDIEGNS